MTRIVITGGEEAVVHMRSRADGVELQINGVTIEVANTWQTPPARALPHAKAPPLAIEGPKPNGKRIGRPPKPRTVARSSARHQPANDQAIIDALQGFGPISTEDFLNRMGLSTKDPRRKITRQRMERMRERGVLKKHPQDQHKRMAFRLIVAAPKS